MKNLLVLFVVAASLSGCNLGSYDDAVDRFNAGRPPTTPPPPPPTGSFAATFSEIQANVFTPTCATANCHSGANPQAGLNLEAANSYAMLVGIASTQDAGIQRINPGNPDNSYLIDKLEGTATTGGQMPPNGALPQVDIDVIRQWITDGAMDDTAQASNPVKVSSLSPMPGAALDAPPANVIAGFDRDLDAATVNEFTFILEASTNGTLGDGDDVPVTAASITLANPQSAVFDLTGVVLADDTYQITLKGTGASLILDLDGQALDGEFSGAFPSGDDAEGGDFVAQFSITTPVMIGPTLDQIQAVIFTPTCATAGCHSGAAPKGGLDLSSAAVSHAQLVGVQSSGDAAETRVIAGDPVNSYLIKKLEGAMGITGNPMPPPNGGVQQSDINEIRQWITDGAML